MHGRACVQPAEWNAPLLDPTFLTFLLVRPLLATCDDLLLPPLTCRHVIRPSPPLVESSGHAWAPLLDLARPPLAPLEPCKSCLDVVPTMTGLLRQASSLVSLPKLKKDEKETETKIEEKPAGTLTSGCSNPRWGGGHTSPALNLLPPRRNPIAHLVKNRRGRHMIGEEERRDVAERVGRHENAEKVHWRWKNMNF